VSFFTPSFRSRRSHTLFPLASICLLDFCLSNRLRRHSCRTRLLLLSRLPAQQLADKRLCLPREHAQVLLQLRRQQPAQQPWQQTLFFRLLPRLLLHAFCWFVRLGCRSSRVASITLLLLLHLIRGRAAAVPRLFQLAKQRRGGVAALEGGALGTLPLQLLCKPQRAQQATFRTEVSTTLHELA
jgi:hypothetical protein